MTGSEVPQKCLSRKNRKRGRKNILRPREASLRKVLLRLQCGTPSYVAVPQNFYFFIILSFFYIFLVMTGSEVPQKCLSRKNRKRGRKNILRPREASLRKVLLRLQCGTPPC